MAELPGVGAAADLRVLLVLLGMRWRAGTRARVARLLSWRGAVSALVIIAVVWALSDAVSGAGVGELAVRVDAAPRDAGLLALALLSAVVLNVAMTTGPPLHFSVAEMNILFSAPIGRTALVLYRYVSFSVGALLSAALLALLLPPGAAGRAWHLVALSLTLIVVQLSSAVLSSWLVVLGRRWSGVPIRRLLLLVLGVSILGSLWLGRQSGLAPAAWLAAASEAGVARIVLAPFGLVAGLYDTSGEATAVLARLVGVLSLIGALLFALVRLDRSLVDEVSASSLMAHRRWQSVLGGASLWRREARAVRSRRAPRRGSGARAIAWTQALSMCRTVMPMLIALLVSSVLGGALVGLFVSPDNASLVAAMAVFVFAFLLPRVAVFDFRGAPAGIERLQGLPLRPWSLCAGQIATPAVLAAVLQLCALVAMLLVLRPFQPLLALAAVLALLPFAFLHYALENLVFLIAPTRRVPVGRLDFDFLGRTLLEFLIKSIALLIALALACAAGVAILLQLPQQRLLAAVLPALVLSGFAAFTLAMLARVFARFDASRHALD